MILRLARQISDLVDRLNRKHEQINYETTLIKSGKSDSKIHPPSEIFRKMKLHLHLHLYIQKSKKKMEVEEEF